MRASMEFKKAYEQFVSALAAKSLPKVRQQLKQLVTINVDRARKSCLNTLCTLTEESDYDPFVKEIIESQIFKPPNNKVLLPVTPTLLFNTARRCKSADELQPILSLLASALKLRDRDLLKILNDDGYSTLHLSVLEGDQNATNIISRYGADCDTLSESGHTALSLCIAYGNDFLAPLFIHESDVNTQDCDKDTPIMFAAWNRQPRVMKILIQHGADVNAVSKHGSTALWNAVFQSSSECVLMLLSQNAKMDVKCAGTHLFLDENQSPIQNERVTKIYGQQKRSLLWVAVDRVGRNDQSLRVLSIILEAGYDVTKEHWLKDATVSHQPDYPKNLQNNQSLQYLLNYLYKKPQTLRDLCRNRLRKYHFENSKAVPFHDWLKIGLPVTVQDFLTLGYITV